MEIDNPIYLTAESLKSTLQSNTIHFHGSDGEILRFTQDGEIYVYGRLIESDDELREGIRAFLRAQRYL